MIGLNLIVAGALATNSLNPTFETSSANNTLTIHQDTTITTNSQNTHNVFQFPHNHPNDNDNNINPDSTYNPDNSDSYLIKAIKSTRIYNPKDTALLDLTEKFQAKFPEINKELHKQSQKFIKSYKKLIKEGIYTQLELEDSFIEAPDYYLEEEISKILYKEIRTHYFCYNSKDLIFKGNPLTGIEQVADWVNGYHYYLDKDGYWDIEGRAGFWFQNNNLYLQALFHLALNLPEKDDTTSIGKGKERQFYKEFLKTYDEISLEPYDPLEICIDKNAQINEYLNAIITNLDLTKEKIYSKANEIIPLSSGDTANITIYKLVENIPLNGNDALKITIPKIGDIRIYPEDLPGYNHIPPYTFVALQEGKTVKDLLPPLKEIIDRLQTQYKK